MPCSLKGIAAGGRQVGRDPGRGRRLVERGEVRVVWRARRASLSGRRSAGRRRSWNSDRSAYVRRPPTGGSRRSGQHVIEIGQELRDAVRGNSAARRRGFLFLVFVGEADRDLIERTVRAAALRQVGPSK